MKKHIDKNKYKKLKIPAFWGMLVLMIAGGIYKMKLLHIGSSTRNHGSLQRNQSLYLQEILIQLHVNYGT